MVKKNTEKSNEKMKVPDVILGYYEGLRDYSLGNHTAFMTPLGMDLFMRKGAAAWIAAWSNDRTDKASSFKAELNTGTVHENIVPQAIHREITVLLANMILTGGAT